GGWGGGAMGKGRATAVLFAREGARVLLVDQSRAAAEITQELIGREGGEAHVCEVDVTRADDCRAMVDEAVRRWGRLDILDNNVGIGGRGNPREVGGAARGDLIRVNRTSKMLTSKHPTPPTAPRGRGSILNNSPTPALRP